MDRQMEQEMDTTFECRGVGFEINISQRLNGQGFLLRIFSRTILSYKGDSYVHPEWSSSRFVKRARSRSNRVGGCHR